MKYVVKGNPIPLCRPRFNQGRRPWDSQREEKVRWGLNVGMQHGSAPLFDGPIHLDVTFYFPAPQSMVKRATEFQDIFIPHYYRPDLSNLIKFVEDAVTGILYRDDCLIVSIRAVKGYSVDPRTEFSISQFLL